MTRERMITLIHNAGFNTQKELAEYFGISPVTIQGWGYKNAIPYWLESWLINKIKADAFEEMTRLNKELLVEVREKIIEV
ncbi:MAG: bacteriophage CI repressor [Campylobacteraceae bacterium]|nr:bacteriophage CI repressor [Campylobacteraceae bacterium]